MISVSLILSSCVRVKHEKNFDPYLELKKEEYAKILSAQDEQEIEQPQFKSFIEDDIEETLPELQTKVSINFTDGTKIQDMLAVIFENIDINISIDCNKKKNLSGKY